MYFTFNDYLLYISCTIIGILSFKFKSFIIVSNDDNNIIVEKINKNSKDINILFEKLDKLV